MTISGIPSSPNAAIPARPDALDTRGTHGTHGHHPAPATPSPNASPNATQAASRVSRSTSAIPVAAPPGTDPELWSILTTEERDFFARSAAQGPLTYSKMMSPNRAPTPSGPSARGGRLDTRV